MIDPKVINELIKNRRSIFPKTYIEKPIPKDIIQQVLENANWAPNHRKTEPWRFKIFTGASLELLSLWHSKYVLDLYGLQNWKLLEFARDY